jgi:hypothetical protein
VLGLRGLDGKSVCSVAVEGTQDELDLSSIDYTHQHMPEDRHQCRDATHSESCCALSSPHRHTLQATQVNTIVRTDLEQGASSEGCINPQQKSSVVAAFDMQTVCGIKEDACSGMDRQAVRRGPMDTTK